MSALSAIKQKVNETTQKLVQDPAMGLGTATSVTRASEGLRCEIQDGAWTLNADLSPDVGGTDSAPDPGVYGRAALGSCLAIGYMIWAAKLDVPIENLEIKIEADYDNGGLLGSADVFPGYQDVRYSVRVESSASEEDVLKVLDAGDKHSPYLDVFTRLQSCRRHVEFVQSS